MNPSLAPAAHGDHGWRNRPDGDDRNGIVRAATVIA
jgi:hypothetical protein